MNCVTKWNKLIIHSPQIVTGEFSDQLVERHQCTTVFVTPFEAEAIQEAPSNPSVIKVTALRMQVNGD